MNRKQGLLVVAALLALAGFGWWFSRPVPSVVVPPQRPPATVRGWEAVLPAPRAEPLPLAAPLPEVPPSTGTTSLLVRDSITKAPLPGARVFAHPPQSAIFGDGTCFGDSYPGPACLERGSIGVTGADGRFALTKDASLVFHVVAAGHRWGVPALLDQALVADLLPGSAVRLTIGRRAELEEPLVVALPGAFPDGLDPDGLGEIKVDAEPGGEIVWTLKGIRDVPGPARGTDAILDEGLEPGTWTYLVRRGFQYGAIYARGIVTVSEGETADLRLDAVPVTAGARVTVKAAVLIPARWNRTLTYIEDFDVEVASPSFIADPISGSGAFLTLRGLDPLNRHLEASGPGAAPGPDGLRRTTLQPALPAGRYRATVGLAGWVTEVEVSGSDPEVRIELPEPGEFRVTLLDAATGKPVPNGWVQWEPAWKGDEQACPEKVHADQPAGSVLLLAPPGTCLVKFGADGYLAGERTLSFVAGSSSEATATLRKGAVLVARLWVNGNAFSGHAQVNAELKLDSEERQRLAADSGATDVVSFMGSTNRGGEVHLAGLWSGPHEITVTGLKGFAPVPAQRVDLQIGTETVVEFDLVRAK